MADEDDMPPLEYVGHTLEFALEGLRPGDQVALKGLTKMDLNGQRGTVLPFKDAQLARKGRLGIRLSNGKEMAIKRENMSKVAPEEAARGDRSAESKKVEESDDDMPPLECDATATKNVCDRQKASESDDDMPPLEYVGAPTGAAQKSHADVEDDDDMPPLEHVGPAASKQEGSRHVDATGDGSDDELPPLEDAGTPVVRQESDDSMPPLEHAGAPAVRQVSDDSMPPLEHAASTSSKPAGRCESGRAKDESEDDMPPLEGVGVATKQVADRRDASKSQDGEASRSKEESDDDMPPLEYVGVANEKSLQAHDCPKPADDSDDDMPPLDYVGDSSKQQDGKVANGKQDKESDDDMPPLEYVGPATTNDKAKASNSKEDSEDDMPPLEYVGPSTMREAPKVVASNAVKHDEPFVAGDVVRIAGLKKKELNGERGVVLQRVAGEDGTRFPVKIESSGQKLSIKGENLTKVEIADFIIASDDSMPPTPTRWPNASKAESDDDMPPLEYVGTSPASGASNKPPSNKVGESQTTSDFLIMKFNAGDAVVLKGLSKKELNGQKGKLVRTCTKVGERLQVKLDSSGQSLSVKPDNVEKIQVEDAMSDDSMPELEYVGTSGKAVGSTAVAQKNGKEDNASEDSMPPLDYVGAAPKQDHEDDDDMPPLEYVGNLSPATKPETNSRPDAGSGASPKQDDDDDDMPPLEYVGNSSPPSKSQTNTTPQAGNGASIASAEFRNGDPVILKGLSKSELNGRRGVITRARPTGDGRLAVSLNGSEMLIKKINLTKAQDGKDEADDDMPPLEDQRNTQTFAQGAASGNAKRCELKVGDAVVLKNLSKQELNGKSGVVLQGSTGADARLRVKLNGSGQTLSIKLENLDKQTVSDADGAESEDSMPPLDYVGNNGPAPSAAAARESESKQDAASDDSMPPLDYVGPATKQESDDDMPPLEYVATNASKEVAGDEASSDESMPPLEQAGGPPKPDSDDDMPPLDYVGPPAKGEASSKPQSNGAGASKGPSSGQHGVGFKVGDPIVLKGLSKKELNGRRGTVLQPSTSADERICVKLDGSGEKLSIKQQNMEKAQADDAKSDDSMPPLDYVGNQQTAARPATVAKKTDADNASDDSMPQLDYVGPAPKQDSDDDMPPLEYVGTGTAPGLGGVDNSKPPLEFVGTADAIQQSPTVAEDSEESMPPLDYVGPPDKGASRVEAEVAQPCPVDGAASDDSMPPLEAHATADANKASIASETSADAEACFARLQVGDAVVLRNFKTVALNGQRGTIIKKNKLTPHDKKEVRLESGKQLSVKAGNVTLATAARQQGSRTEDTSDDPMSPSANQKLLENERLQNRAFQPGDIVVLKDLNNPSMNGQRATVLHPTSRTHEDRCAVKIISSGQRLSVKFDKIEKLYPDENRQKTPLSSLGPTVKDIRIPRESVAPLATTSPKENKSPSKTKGAQPGKPVVSAESLLERMREAQASNSDELIADVLAAVENATDVHWGDLLAKKKQAMKKLRAKRKKTAGDAPSPSSLNALVESSEPPTAAETEMATSPLRGKTFLKPPAPQSEMSDIDRQSTFSDMNWVVLDPGRTLDDWCTSLNMPPLLLQRLKEEEVTCPKELAFVPEEELKELVKDLKMGPKGRFLAAVQLLRNA